MFSRFQMITLPYRVFGKVDSIRSFDVGTQLSMKFKKNHIIPNAENKIFQENRFLRLHLRENSDFYPEHGRFLSQLDKQFAKPEARKLLRHTTHTRSVVLNQRTFIKEH
jgi:transcription-repair coupling factor (superfamily II helicase)